MNKSYLLFRKCPGNESKMRSNKIFCHDRFKKQLLTASISMTVLYIMSLADTLVAGNMLGENAIVGLNLVSPLLTIIGFISMMVGTGTAYRFSYEMGSFHRERAQEYIGQGFILAAFFSVVLFCLTFFFRENYFDFVRTTDAVMFYTKDYYSWYPYIAASYPILVLMQDLVYADGGMKTCTIANIVQITGNLGISVLLCRVSGISGISLGTLIGNLLAIAILTTHFLKKESALKIRLHLALRDVCHVFKLSFVHASLYLYLGFSNMIINRHFLSSFGDEYFPVLTIMYGITSLAMVFDGVGQAMEPIINIYRGENNTDGIRKMMKYALKAAVAEGLAVMLLLFLAGGRIASIYNITSPALVAIAGRAVRIYAPAMVFYSLVYLYEMYYLLTGHTFLSASMTLLKNFAVLTGLVILLSDAFGIDGVWIGMSLTPMVTLMIYAVILFVRHHRFMPLLLEENDIVSKDIIVTPEQVIGLRDWVEEEFDKRGIGSSKRNRAMLLTEECGMQILSKNDASPVLLEASLFFEDNIRLIMRDNGENFEVTNADEHLNFRGMFLAGLSESFISTNYMLTANYNRNQFVI